MSDKEKIVMIQTILSFVEEIQKGQQLATNGGIAIRLKHYADVYDNYPPDISKA